MKVILIKDVPKLGKKLDIKNVSDGHALNMLIPQGLVIQATPQTIKKAESDKKRLEGDKKLHEEMLVKSIEGLDGLTLNIKGKANDKGHLFAGLHREEIAAELKRQTELQVDPSFIQLEHPIKEIGEHAVEVKGGGKSAKFRVMIERA